MTMMKFSLFLLLTTCLLMTRYGVVALAPSELSRLRQQFLRPLTNDDSADAMAPPNSNHHHNNDSKISNTVEMTETASSIKNRRKFFGSIISTTALATSTSWFKNKNDNMAYAATTAAAEKGGDVKSTTTSPASKFVGTFSDPINHPGGTRTIRLLENDNSKIGDYQLAEVAGGGGVGEPKNYILPAVVIGDRAIVIDFSPKGGPKDFTGVLDKDGSSIKFLRDGNVWPRLKKEKSPS